MKEINRKIAEMMGWTPFCQEGDSSWTYIDENNEYRNLCDISSYGWKTFNPSGNIADAWKVANWIPKEKMWSFLKNLSARYKDKNGKHWLHFIWDFFKDPDAPMAICLAALKAMEDK